MRVPSVCSTTHRFDIGVNPRAPGSRCTISTSMLRPAPCTTTASLNPASTHAFVTVGALAAVLSSRVMPMALSCTLAATTITTMTRPRAPVAIPLFRPGLLLPGQL